MTIKNPHFANCVEEAGQYTRAWSGGEESPGLVKVEEEPERATGARGRAARPSRERQCEKTSSMAAVLPDDPLTSTGYLLSSKRGG